MSMTPERLAVLRTIEAKNGYWTPAEIDTVSECLGPLLAQIDDLTRHPAFTSPEGDLSEHTHVLDGPIVNNTDRLRIGIQLPGEPGQTTDGVWRKIRRARSRLVGKGIPGTERWHQEMRDGVAWFGWSIDFNSETEIKAGNHPSGSAATPPEQAAALDSYHGHGWIGYPPELGRPSAYDMPVGSVVVTKTGRTYAFTETPRRPSGWRDATGYYVGADRIEELFSEGLVTEWRLP